jgi:hypothetical protein
MTTIEKATHYSAVLKKNFGVGVPESIDLASVLDELAVQNYKQLELLKRTLEAMQQLFPQNGNEGGVAVWRLGASYAAKEAISAIEEQFKW